MKPIFGRKSKNKKEPFNEVADFMDLDFGQALNYLQVFKGNHERLTFFIELD